MKKLSGWALALIIIGVLLVLGLVFRFILANRVITAATKVGTATNGGDSGINKGDTVAGATDKASTLSKLRRAV